MTVESRSNGATAVLRLGDLLPQRRPVEVNGTTYMGYVRGTGCPRSVLLEFQLAYDAWQRADEAARAEGRPSDPAGWQRFLDGALLAALPGIPYETVDLIPEAKALEVLRFLGWTGQAVEADGDESAEPPKAGPRPTGAGSSPRKRGSAPSAESAATTSGG